VDQRRTGEAEDSSHARGRDSALVELRERIATPGDSYDIADLDRSVEGLAVAPSK
jgi:hypothetical protein